MYSYPCHPCASKDQESGFLIEVTEQSPSNVVDNHMVNLEDSPSKTTKECNTIRMEEQIKLHH